MSGTSEPGVHQQLEHVLVIIVVILGAPTPNISRHLEIEQLGFAGHTPGKNKKHRKRMVYVVGQ